VGSGSLSVADVGILTDNPSVIATRMPWRQALDSHAYSLVVVVSLVAAAIPRFFALHDDSVFYPDEIFQTLEQAHRFAFGYGFIPWEFREAARSWLLPLVLGLTLKLAAALGMVRGPTLAHFARGLMVLLAFVGQWATIRLAYLRGGRAAAILAGAIYAAFPLLIISAHVAPRRWRPRQCLRAARFCSSARRTVLRVMDATRSQLAH
jgi:hypothetical protein